jgi:hypothetical protein
MVSGLLLLVVGCTRPTGYYDGAFDRRSGDTEYRIEDRADGSFMIHVRMAQYQFIPELTGLEERCRREATALGLEEADRRGFSRPRTDEQRVRSSAGRNAFGGISSCSASAPIVSS